MAWAKWKSKGLGLCFFYWLLTCLPVLAFVDGSFPRHGSSYQHWPDSMSLHFLDDYQLVEQFLMHQGQRVNIHDQWPIHHDLLLPVDQQWPEGQWQWHWQVLSGFDQMHQGVLGFAIGEPYRGAQLSINERRLWPHALVMQGWQLAALLLSLLCCYWRPSRWALFLLGLPSLLLLAHYGHWLWPWHGQLLGQNPWLQWQAGWLLLSIALLLCPARRPVTLTALILMLLVWLAAWQPWPKPESVHLHNSKAFYFDALQSGGQPWQRVLPVGDYQLYLRLQNQRQGQGQSFWLTIYNPRAQVMVPSRVALRIEGEAVSQHLTGQLVRDDFVFLLPDLVAGAYQWHLTVDWPEPRHWHWSLDILP